MRKTFNLPGTLLLLALVCAWEAWARAVNSPNFPTFLAVLGVLGSEMGVLLRQTGITLGRAAGGFALALATMLPLGIYLGRTPRVAQFFEPVIDLLRPLPSLAIVPVVMLFAGIGTAAKISVVFYGAAFPILINTIDATRATHPLLLHVGRSLGLSRAEIMRTIDLPSALPQIMAGVRLSVAIALLISVSSEMLLSTDGMGNFLVRAQESFRIADGLAGLLVVALASLAVNVGVLRIERHLLAWHHQRHGL